MATRIQLRRGTAAEWTAADPVLAAAEEGHETDTDKRKVGNGVSLWSELPYFGGEPDPAVYPAGDTTGATDGHVWTYDEASGGWLASPANAHSHANATTSAAGFESAAHFAKTERVPDAETEQRVVYVSPTGSNSTGDGSSAAPWATIQHAVNQARAFLQPQNGLSAYKIVCKPGTYSGLTIIPPNIFSAANINGQGGIWIVSETGVAADVIISSSGGFAGITAFGSCSIDRVSIQHNLRGVAASGSPAVFCTVADCVLSSSGTAHVAAISTEIATIYSRRNSSPAGALYDTGLQAGVGGEIAKGGGQPIGATANELIYSGGVIR